MRPLSVLVIADPIAGLRPAHDSTVSLVEAAQERGHRVLFTTIEGLHVHRYRAYARCHPLTVEPARLEAGEWVCREDWWRGGADLDVRLDDVDVVLMRTDPPVDRAYLRATFLLDQVDTSRVVLVNSPVGLREANEKLFTLRFGDVAPETVVTADAAEIIAATREWGRAVLKPTDGMAGRGIMLLNPDDPNLASIIESGTGRGRHHVVVQRYLPAAESGDRRIIVFDGEPLGAVRRLAPPGEFRCNMAVGATTVADRVDDDDRTICHRLSAELARLGILFTGLDVIGGRLTEINVTSPTGLREIEAHSGERISEKIIVRLEDLAARLRSAGMRADTKGPACRPANRS